ncbi:CLUMA_CG013285, isoform A [Clunio marinus]|uniref:CLUMA_CG013285, isoform A n=1 Tax=Clunio marinus TaxID=568069 RepID=A0A1J1IJQ4_9DIPT|nr:CLUMA_CG013285, isoform A [Clunio marinus]
MITVNFKFSFIALIALQGVKFQHPSRKIRFLSFLSVKIDPQRHHLTVNLHLNFILINKLETLQVKFNDKQCHPRHQN